MAMLTSHDDYMSAMDRAYRFYSDRRPGHDVQNVPLTYTKKEMVEEGFWCIGHLWDDTANLKVEVHWEPKSDRVRVGRARPLRSEAQLRAARASAGWKL